MSKYKPAKTPEQPTPSSLLNSGHTCTLRPCPFQELLVPSDTAASINQQSISKIGGANSEPSRLPPPGMSDHDTGWGFSGLAVPKTKSRQEKGTINVDPDKVQEELCTTIFAHRAFFSKLNLSEETRTYLATTEKQDEETIKKTGRELITIKRLGERRAATYITKQNEHQTVRNLKNNLRDLMAKVDSLDKAGTPSEDNSGEAEIDELSTAFPGLGPSTRNGRGTKRKQELDDISTELQRLAKLLKDERRQS